MAGLFFLRYNRSMDNIFITVTLSLIQGLTEFLPISSSGHLVLIPYLFGFEEMGLGFSVALHIGTLLAVLLYFRKDWVEIFRLAFYKKVGSVYDMHQYVYTKRTLHYLVIATLPAACIGFFLNDSLEIVAQYPIIVAGLILISGAVLWSADIHGKKLRKTQSIRMRDAIIIGLSQVLALIPGVSRSGMTITAGLFLGLTRREAARFSFLMATPVIVGAGILKIPDLIDVGLGKEVIIGIVLSFVSAYVAIKYMLALIERVHYKVFFWYSLMLVFVVFAFSFFEKV